MASMPVSQVEMDSLADALQMLMEQIAARRAREQDVWLLLDRASTMVERATDGPFERDLQNVYALLSAVWSSVRGVAELHNTLEDEGD